MAQSPPPATPAPTPPPAPPVVAPAPLPPPGPDSVEAAAAGAGCSTVVVDGLSQQIIGEAMCMEPQSLVALPILPNLALGEAVYPLLERPARDALIAALADAPQRTLEVASMYRTVAQQFLLYRWYERGVCNIKLAATPGRSNHESGLALDIADAPGWRPILEAHGFAWMGDKDPVHFDYAKEDAIDWRGLDVLAFQRLHNRNHPTDRLNEDGDWGDATRDRMARAPAKGFPVGAVCGRAP